MPLRQRIAAAIAANKSLLIFFALMLVFRSAVADWMYVPSGSMNPTIVEGDRIWVDKAAYGWRIPFTTKRLTAGRDPARGDIVIFASPEDGDTLVKRVIGLPGDIVEMRDEALRINGAAVDYDTADVAAADAELPLATRRQPRAYRTENLDAHAHPIMLLTAIPARRTFGPLTVPAGQYLVLGDNRDNSKDSRYIGFIARDTIVGRAERVVYSLDAEHWYRPRADRLLVRLQ